MSRFDARCETIILRDYEYQTSMSKGCGPVHALSYDGRSVIPMTETFDMFERILENERERMLARVKAALAEEYETLLEQAETRFETALTAQAEELQDWVRDRSDALRTELHEELENGIERIEARMRSAIAEEVRDHFAQAERCCGSESALTRPRPPPTPTPKPTYSASNADFAAKLQLRKGGALTMMNDTTDGVSVSTPELYLSSHVIEKIMQHTSAYASRRLEAMGLLLGDVRRSRGRIYTLVEDAVTGGLDTTAVSVRFKREAFSELFEELEKIEYEYLIIGWYHSHPGYTCFMSPTDVDTQRRMFRQPYQSAVVVDPIKREMKAYQLRNHSYRERPYGVYDSRTYPYPLAELERDDAVGPADEAASGADARTSDDTDGG